MLTTEHMSRRMRERGINPVMIDLVMQFGFSEGDKLILDRKNIDCILVEVRKVAKSLERMRARGGICVVGVGESLITAYDLNSYKRPGRKSSQSGH